MSVSTVDLMFRAPAIQALFAVYGGANYSKEQNRRSVFVEHKAGNCIAAARVLVRLLHESGSPSCLLIQNTLRQEIHMAAGLFVGGRLETAEMSITGLETRDLPIDSALVDTVNDGLIAEAHKNMGNYLIESATGAAVNTVLVPPSISDEFARRVVEGTNTRSLWPSVLATTVFYQQAA